MEEEKTETPKAAPIVETKKKLGQPSASEDTASPYPDMDLCQNIHKLTVGVAEPELQAAVLKQISTDLENPSLYRLLQKTLEFTSGLLSEANLLEMETKHAKHLEELEAKVEEAKESAGDMEVMDARVKIARFAAKSLSEDQALLAYKKLLDLPKVSSGKKIDSMMESSRVASFYGDIAKSDEFIESVSRNQPSPGLVGCIQSTCVNMSLTHYAFQCCHRLKNWPPKEAVVTGTVEID
jgi:hypothetical protein